MSIREHIQEQILLFDGAMGSMFASIHPDPHYPSEYANITSPHTISGIHHSYLMAGAKAIKTNTFSLPKGSDTLFSLEEIVETACDLALEQAKPFGAYVFGDITISEMDDMGYDYYKNIVDIFLKKGICHFLLETCSSTLHVKELFQYIRSKESDSFLICSFAVNSDGFSKSGHHIQKICQEMEGHTDALGLNCICGPHHMTALVKEIKTQHYCSVMPNASYPTVQGNRVSYGQNPHYFAEKMKDIAQNGCHILGGCCGTTPEFIAQLKNILEGMPQNPKGNHVPALLSTEIKSSSAFYEKLKSGKKPIAVEWDSPNVPEIREYMAKARQLQEIGVDLITLADSPGARPRMDSSLVACKVKRELGMDVLPHMTCRDRNINACKGLLLGLSVEEIRDVLIITGDPIPQEQRKEIKTVYEFNSRKLIRHITELNQSLFHDPFYLYAALNVNALNFDVQLRMAKEKIDCGAVAFFTQPVLSQRGLDNMKRAKEELSVPLVGGVFPATSHRNLSFLVNEMSGFHVSDEIFNLYLDKSPEECTELSIKISNRVVEEITPYVDGYYLITPFKRVDLILEIIKNMSK